MQSLLSTWGYGIVFLFVGVESTGIPFPGETMLMIASAYAGAGHLDIQWVILAAIAGAIVGDNTGYWLGRTGGRRIVERYGHRIRLDGGKLDRAQTFYARHGDKTVFFGRFVVVLRAWSAFLAGMNRMPYPRFLVFDAGAGIAWAVLWGVLAFEFGRNISVLERLARDVGIAGVIIVVVAAIVLFVLHRRGQAARKQLDVAGGPPDEPVRYDSTASK